jgi:hypothetical protein
VRSVLNQSQGKWRMLRTTKNVSPMKPEAGLVGAVFHSRLAEARKADLDRPRIVNSLERSTQL